MSNNETYLSVGKHFTSYEEVEAYAEKYGLRITNTETIRRKGRKIYLITLTVNR